ncbi:signal transduction histidine kinase regulating citrate/malate metabolism [Desulfitobacterium sp. LBE]|uniref:Histidine kinase n=4 Tax=root TaxID=1 RepID=A0A0W1JLM8_DESHA|nr:MULTISPECIES: Spo0B domain-containing protein [Desulfitobacterium]ACL22340.1 signal transduction histidine kinase regulating citrate/malate metabolism [Desulfitobacterium hafniense DCB-2]KTE92158.1 histidine kinase [Desulfitobacterium hafniense]MEA5021444.1 Spo0B domain-containing protein [Desulfitobacterium hafniense]TWH59885.1 signal transduction histidine kinase regulating citrate/malate metabolism [Desulfitobacterium sp. LBE]
MCYMRNKPQKGLKTVPGKSSLERTLLTEQLDHYRLQRHDFFNHWQVIKGYLQLGKADRALLYMQEGISGLEAEQDIGQIPQEIVGAILLGLVVELRKEGLWVEVQLDSALKKERFWQEFWQEEYGEVLYGYTKECVKAIFKRYKGLEEPVVEIKLGTGEALCSLSLLDDDKVVWKQSCCYKDSEQQFIAQ